MQRLVVLGLVLLGACGSHKSGTSLCDQDPSRPECTTACDPNAPDTCPAGFHCTPGGTCDAECTPTGGECGDGFTCTPDGRCEPTGGGGPDANCPAVHFTPMKTTPSIELVIDRSGSMDQTDIAPTRYKAITNGLFGTNGAVTATQGSVYFGEALFAGDQDPCLSLAGFTAPRALNNAAALKALTTNNPPNNGSTPTAPAITKVVADFAANPPPMGSPPVILLATDGEPNSCTGSGGTGPSITAAKNAYNAGIQLFILGLAGLNTQFLQDMANAGTGKPTGQAPNCAGCSKFYTANNPTSLSTALNQIINGVLSCDLALTGQVDPATACDGTVTLDGMPLQCGTDWNVDPNGMIIHLLGQACTDFKNSANPVVDAAFPCGTVIL